MLSLRIKSNIAPLTRLTERYPAESVAARTSRITEVLLYAGASHQTGYSPLAPARSTFETRFFTG